MKIYFQTDNPPNQNIDAPYVEVNKGGGYVTDAPAPQTEPRTSNIEGEHNFVQAGKEVGVQVGFNSPDSHSRGTGREFYTDVVMPVTGAVTNPAVTIPGGLVLIVLGACVVVASRKRRKGGKR